jgi:shikimate kinase
MRALAPHAAVGHDRFVLVAVVSGPIASGKSTLSRAVAARLGETSGVEGTAIDLDIVYEMLDPERRPKSDALLWAAARRVAGRLAAALLTEGRSVIAEGDFSGERALDEFIGELPNGVHPRLVLLHVDFTEAFDRAAADPTRGLSRDRDFLSAHYRDLVPLWDASREVLHLDTGRLTVDEAATAMIEWLAKAQIESSP